MTDDQLPADFPIQFAHDGWSVHRKENSQQTLLGLLALHDGSTVCEIWLPPYPADDTSNVTRDELLLTAICRHLNTGGDPFDVLARLQRVDVRPEPVVYPRDYELALSRLDNEGYYTHLFVAADHGVVWREAAYVERVTLQDVYEILQVDGLDVQEEDDGPSPG